MTFHPDFIARIQEVHKEKGLLWLRGLSSHIDSLSKRWDFSFIAPLTELSYGFVARVEYKGQEAILKMNPGIDIIQHEVHWLSAFSSVTPQIFQSALDERAFLMEKIEPGTPLKYMFKAGDDDRATRIICQLVRDLQSIRYESNEFPHLSEMKHISLLHGHFDKKLVQKAESLYADLTTKSLTDIVLHGDLHHDNILSSGDDWKIIDPHGYKGDPVFEIAPFVYNPLDMLPQHPDLEKILHRRIDILSEEMPYDRKRIEAWAFCMMMLSMAWTFEGTGLVPQFESRAARILSSLV